MWETLRGNFVSCTPLLTAQLTRTALNKKTKSPEARYYGVTAITILMCATKLKELGLIKGFAAKANGREIAYVEGLMPDEYEVMYAKIQGTSFMPRDSEVWLPTPAHYQMQ